MPYRVSNRSRRVDREIAALPPYIYPRIQEAIRLLTREPRPLHCVKIDGDSYRIRVGRYRVIYEVDDAAQEVIITHVAIRNESTYR
ncbi:MAG: type II toxin-antitoxin system RelE/ParE family toxin [Chloroflexi bacterium]|nr:type II toxin-antitoxin system RelE/ParE family toxin [Chloroflexota bacterium]